MRIRAHVPARVAEWEVACASVRMGPIQWVHGAARGPPRAPDGARGAAEPTLGAPRVSG